MLLHTQACRRIPFTTSFVLWVNVFSGMMSQMISGLNRTFIDLLSSRGRVQITSCFIVIVFVGFVSFRPTGSLRQMFHEFRLSVCLDIILFLVSVARFWPVQQFRCQKPTFRKYVEGETSMTCWKTRKNRKIWRVLHGLVRKHLFIMGFLSNGKIYFTHLDFNPYIVLLVFRARCQLMFSFRPFSAVSRFPDVTRFMRFDCSMATLRVRATALRMRQCQCTSSSHAVTLRSHLTWSALETEDVPPGCTPPGTVSRPINISWWFAGFSFNLLFSWLQGLMYFFLLDL